MRRTTGTADGLYAVAVGTALRRRLGLTDALLALGFVAAAEVETLVRGGNQLATAAPGALSLGCLALRRTRPLLAMSILAVAWSLGTVVQTWFVPRGAGSTDAVVPIFALIVLTYSLGAHGSTRELVAGAIQVLLVILVQDVLHPGSNPLPGALLFFGVFVVGAPALAGRLVRGRNALMAHLRQQEALIDAQQTAFTRSAPALERLRLGDQLHGTLLAGMRSLVAQAKAAQDAAGDLQAEAVTGIETTARALLAETRQVVVALASGSPANTAGRAPATLDGVRPSGQAGDAGDGGALPWTALAAAALGIGLLLEVRTMPVHVPMPLALVACLVIAAPVAMAQARPLLMTTALWAAAALFSAVVAPLGAIFAAISLSFLPPFVVAAFESRGRAVAGFGVCCLGELACFGPSALPLNVAILVCAWVAGRVLHERSRLVRELRLSNLVLEAQRDAASRQVVLEERARFARELHDAVGHTLTVIALQAGAARRMWTTDHARAEAALETIARVALDGLAELRLGFDPTEAVSHHSTHRTAIEDLLDGAREAGLSVDLHVEGPEATLPPDTQLAAYRMLQEALTNVLKHAPGTSADVAIRNLGPHLEVVVANTGMHGAAGDSIQGGHGLKGMQERIEACGGRLTWRRRPEGGFEVRAQLPLEMATA